MKKILVRLSALLGLQQSAMLPLLGLVFLAWSLIEPAPMHVMSGVSVSQALSTVAFAIYVFLAVRELWREMFRAQSRDPS